MGAEFGGIFAFPHGDTHMRLTDTFVRKVKKPGKYFDGDGGYLLVTKTLSKPWRQKYRFNRVENTLAHGMYPAVPLAEFRKRVAAALELLARGVDPSEYRKVQKAATREQAKNSFEVVAREWFAKYTVNWAPSHSSKVIARLENDVFPGSARGQLPLWRRTRRRF